MTLEKLQELQVLHLDTIYGKLVIDDPLAIELIASKPFQRLKEINQYGVVNFIVATENYTRFDHSIGVYWLLKSHNFSRNEQIAGLLHDVSHTVFSHVGDYVFQEKYPGNSYQDDIHLWYLKESGLESILEKYFLTVNDVDHKSSQFKGLDRPLPFLCADRIEYNLQGGLLRKLLTMEDFHAIHKSLNFNEGEWSIQSIDCAQKLGYCSLIMTETLWGAAWESLSYRFTAEALRKSFTIGLITFDEFHFSNDTLVWNKLVESSDPYIKTRMNQIKDIHSTYTLTKHGNEDLLLKLKFRGIDPLVSTPQGLIPLTHTNEQYRIEYTRVQEQMKSGWPIKFLKH